MTLGVRVKTECICLGEGPFVGSSEHDNGSFMSSGRGNFLLAEQLPQEGLRSTYVELT
jgi:hypothetical protein